MAMTPQLSALAQATAAKYGIPWNLGRAIIQQESGGNPRAVSPAGAQGLMQLMPGTAKDMGVSDPFDPAQNLEGGFKYFRWLLDRYGGDTAKALAGYNAGPGRADRYGANVPIAETQNYVRRILERSGGAIPSSPVSTESIGGGVIMDEPLMAQDQQSLMPQGQAQGLLEEPTGLNWGIVAEAMARHPGPLGVSKLAAGLGAAERFEAEQRAQAQERLYRAEDRDYRRRAQEQEQMMRDQQQQGRNAMADQLEAAGRPMDAQLVRSGQVDPSNYLPRMITTEGVDQYGMPTQQQVVFNPITMTTSSAQPTRAVIAGATGQPAPGDRAEIVYQQLRPEFRTLVPGMSVDEAYEKQLEADADLAKEQRTAEQALAKEYRATAEAQRKEFEKLAAKPKEVMDQWDLVRDVNPNTEAAEEDVRLIKAYSKALLPNEAVMSDDLSMLITAGETPAETQIRQWLRGNELNPPMRQRMKEFIRGKAEGAWYDYTGTVSRFTELAPEGMERQVVPPIGRPDMSMFLDVPEEPESGVDLGGGFSMTP